MGNLLLLHGAIGSIDQFNSLSKELSLEFLTYTFNFPGHGGEPIPQSGFSIQLFAEATLAFMDKNNLEKISIFGYSMGGYVALYLAKYFPERIEKVITLATKFHWDELTAQKEVRMLDADKIEAKIPAFATELQKRHAPVDWRSVLNHTSEMLLEMGKDNPLKREDYSTIKTPALILLGDNDKMVTLEETIAVNELLPNSRLEILANTSHPLEQVDAEMLATYIRDFDI